MDRMILDDLHKTIDGFNDIFHRKSKEKSNGYSTIDDYIHLSKKYVNSLDVDADTNVELQRYFVKHVEGLYRSTFETEKMLAEVEKFYNTMYGLKASGIFFSIVNPLATGVAAYLVTKNIFASVATAAAVLGLTILERGNALYEYSKNAMNIPGLREYSQKILSELEDRLISIDKLTID